MSSIHTATVTPATCPLRHAPAAQSEMAAAPSGLRRALYLSAGWVALVTGVVGIFVPLLPTTCFLLSAAWCFGKSSPALARWMHENRWFGAHLTRYREHRTVARSVKTGSLATLWATLGATTLLTTPPVWVVLLLLTVGVAVSMHVGGLATAAEDA